MEENKTQEKLFTPETKTILFLVDTQEKCTKYVGTNKKDFPIIEVVFEAIKYFLRELQKDLIKLFHNQILQNKI